jgi:rare lipoprotein A
MHKLTAAHRRLPLDTRVRVTNLSNGRTVEVTVTDRGPYADGRVIDLSARAAEALDLKKRGIGRVRIEVIDDEAG